MNFSKSILNKDLYELTLEDVEEFFKSTQDETINLEFKSYVDRGKYSDKENAVKKAICGLLNSEGGIVIWGAPVETKDENGNTSAQGDLTQFETSLDRDRIINIITSSITPFPTGIKVQPILSFENKALFVFEVQKSIGRPHQFSNNYFVRLDGQTRIAPHYLISALFKSVDYPELRGQLRLNKIDNNGSS